MGHVMDAANDLGASGSFPFLLPGEKVELTVEKTVDLFGNGALVLHAADLTVGRRARWPHRNSSGYELQTLLQV